MIEFYKIELARQWATECQQRWGGIWHIISLPHGKFDYMKDSDRRNYHKVIETIGVEGGEVEQEGK